MSDDLAAVTGCVTGYKSLRDGTLRIQIDIEPRDVPTFHQTFPENDLHAVVARLSDPRKIEKGGPISNDAGMLCQTQDFQGFVSTKRDQTDAFYAPTEEMAAVYVRWYCDVESRARLDGNKDAANRYRQIKEEFVNWRDRGVRGDG